MTWGDLILNARTERGLTQKELAALSGVEHSRISRIERGGERSGANEETWAALAKALELIFIPSKPAMLYKEAKS